LNTEFKESFLRDLRTIRDRALLERIKEVIERVEQAPKVQDLANLKKLKGERNHYRFRVGDYRIGLKIEGSLVTFVRILNRKDIYKYFPR
jgi:mRNA interferase RelE/StbE